MRSIIFASLVAVALAASPAFERTFEPRTEYHYKFDGLILSGLPTASSELSQTRISARARLQTVDDRYIHLQLIKIRMAASHKPETETMPVVNSLEQRELTREQIELLELPVRAYLRNGLVSDIEFEKEDAEWSKNLKRAVLNMISVNPTMPKEDIESRYNVEEKELYEDNLSFFTNEKTIEGDCQVAYSIVREEKKTIVTKSVNFDKCTLRPEIVTGLRYSSECPECENEKQFVRPQTIYTYVFEKDLLKEVEVRSIYTLNINGQEVMKTETRSMLIHEETHNIRNEIKKVHGEKEELIYSSRWEQLVEDFYKNGDKSEIMPFERIPTDKKIKMVKMLVEQMQEFENNMPETTHQLARLVNILRMTTVEELEKIHNTLYVKADKKIQSVIEHALAIAGTKNTVHHLIRHIEKRDITPFKAAQLLKSIQETPYPSESIVDLLIELARSHVGKREEVIRQSAWLAAGSVVRGVVSKTSDVYLVREVTRDIKEKFVLIFMEEFKKSSNVYEKILALKALGNAGIDMSVYELNEIIVDKMQPLPIRKEAIDALRLFKDSMPRKLQKILLPVYKNRHFAPELRMAALWRMMHTRPEEQILVQVVSQMEKETNQQVAAFTYQVIRHFAKSTNPCYERVAKEAARLLTFTRYQPQKQILSVYAQLPIFSQDVLSGAQIDLASIFEKTSFLPKDLSVSLDSVLGGNWNKYLAQIGFSQQNMDRFIVKMIERLEKKTMVRGRRFESNLSILKDLAKNMNIRPRLYDEKDSYGMLYLRYKDMDFAVLPIDIERIERMINEEEFDLVTLFNMLNKEFEYESHHAAFFYELTRQLPTTLGLPLTISGKLPTVFSVEGKLSLETTSGNVRFNVEMRPSVAATHVYEMRFFTPLFEQGVKNVQSIRAFVPITLKTENVFGKKNTFTMKVVIPENQKSIVAISSRPVVMLRFPGLSMTEYVEAEERTVVIPQWQQKTQELEKMFELLGLHLTVRGNVLNQWTLENLFMAEQDIEYTMENKQRPVELTFQLTNVFDRDADLSEIKFDKIFEKEFELEDELMEKRRDYFHKMIKRIQKENGYKFTVALDMEAKRDLYMNSELVVLCDKEFRMCKMNLKSRRSPLMEESKEWTIDTEVVVAYPELPSSLRQLREQPHREVQLALNAKWGSMKKNDVVLNVQLQQSKEQKMVIRNLMQSYNGMPEYELLIKAARLNQVNAVAEYNFSPETEQVFGRFFELIKAYNFWTVSTKKQENENRRVVLSLSVEPMTREYINMTIQTPEEFVEMMNVQVPRVYLPSIAQRSVRHQLTGKMDSVCRIEKNEVRTFDNLIYTAPITTCYSLVAKDCSENPTFAVLAKKVSKKSNEMIVKIMRHEEEIVMQMIDDELIVKIDGKKVHSRELEKYQIEKLGDSLYIVRLTEGEVHFDGYTVKTQLPTYLRKNQFCGLCGNNDDEMTNDFRTAEDKETSDIEEFHRSYLLKDDECEVEEELLSEKKNYKKAIRYQEDSYETEEYDYNTEKDSKKTLKHEKNMIEKTQIKEFSHRVCFSLEPVVECKRGFEEEKNVQKKIRFTCLPRHNSTARRLLKEARDEVLVLEDYPVSYVEPIYMPTACVAY